MLCVNRPLNNSLQVFEIERLLALSLAFESQIQRGIQIWSLPTSKILILFSLDHFLTAFDLCMGSLSCQKIGSSPRQRFFFCQLPHVLFQRLVAHISKDYPKSEDHHQGCHVIWANDAKISMQVLYCMPQFCLSWPGRGMPLVICFLVKWCKVRFYLT